MKAGERAYAVAVVLGQERMFGKAGRVLGRGNLHADRPDERGDTKILETRIDLDTADRLVSGPRVDVYVIVDPGG